MKGVATAAANTVRRVSRLFFPDMIVSFLLMIPEVALLRGWSVFSLHQSRATRSQANLPMRLIACWPSGRIAAKNGQM